MRTGEAYRQMHAVPVGGKCIRTALYYEPGRLLPQRSWLQRHQVNRPHDTAVRGGNTQTVQPVRAVAGERWMRGEERQCRIVGSEVLLLGIFAVTAYRDWKEQMICVYVPLAAGIAGLVLHLMLPTQKLTDLLLGAGIGAVLLLAAWVSRERLATGWRNADGKRYFFWDSGGMWSCLATYVDCSGGVVWTHCEA